MNQTLLKTLLQNNYHVMVLKLFVANNDMRLAYMDAIEKREKKWLTSCDFVDAGFDLFNPSEKMIKPLNFNANMHAAMIDYEIKCAAYMYTALDKAPTSTGFYLYPRSSISKTPFRLANSVGIIDSGYRGNIMAALDCLLDYGQKVNKMDRLVQICAPNLCPILVEIVSNEEELSTKTERASGGFGSTGK